ncbi:MAG: putative toxin-antitoxin system toxin component, PIN family [Nitrospirae bacterium]|nr:putative toxin-antitoxin system toxin component, PIN family [Nitrospirota bacterium]
MSGMQGVLVRVVLDTNILISSLISSSAAVNELVDRWRNGCFAVVSSEQQITELREVLSRPKFLFKYRIKERQIADMVSLMVERTQRVSLKKTVCVCRDPDDDIVIETAIRGNARYLITGDKDIFEDSSVLAFLMRHGVTAVRAVQFLSVINKAY